MVAAGDSILHAPSQVLVLSISAASSCASQMLEQVDPIRDHLVFHQFPDEMLCAYQCGVMLFYSLNFQAGLSRPLNLRKAKLLLARLAQRPNH
jgi:hypothetical protein